jgi:predicted TIM-barrel fold metal-dependent hydrolase
MKIDIYTHIVPPKYKAALSKVAPHFENHLGRMPTLYDMDQRFRIMDKYKDLRQVLTMAMTATLIFEEPMWAVDFAKLANDEMAEMVMRYPDRFAAGVASLPMIDIDTAVKEFDRAIQGLRLRGLQLLTSVNRKPLNLEEWMPLFEKMSKYDLPIWIHPVRPIDRSDYERYFIDHVFGWPYESTVTMTHLVLNGLFERCPGIKIIIHHCGALVPFFSQRISEAYNASGTIHGMEGRMRRPPIEYFKKFYTDTALSGSASGLMCGHSFFGADHLLFGTDMPYDSEFGDRTIRQTIQSVEQMTISDSEKKMIFGDNAKKVLGLEKGPQS